MPPFTSRSVLSSKLKEGRGCSAQQKQAQHGAAQALVDGIISASEAILQTQAAGSDHSTQSLSGMSALLVDKVAGLLTIPGPNIRAIDFSRLLPVAGQALAIVYTLESEPLIAKVMQTWQSIAEWLALQHTCKGALWHISNSTPINLGTTSRTEAIQQVVDQALQRRSLAAVLVTLMHSFVQITGVNPLLEMPCTPLVINMFTMLIADIGTRLIKPTAGAQLGAEPKGLLAASCVFEILCDGPIQQLLRAIQQRVPLSSSLFSTLWTVNHADARVNDVLQQTEQPCSIQLYCLVIWLLQQPALHQAEWEETIHGPAVMDMLLRCFTALGGSQQSLSNCILATLHGVATAFIGNQQAKTTTKSRNTVQQPVTAGNLQENSQVVNVATMEDAAMVAEVDDMHPLAVPTGKDTNALQVSKVQTQQDMRARQDWAWTQAGTRVLSCLAAHGDISAVMIALMGLTRAHEDKAAVVGVFELVSVMWCKGNTAGLLAALIDVLRPESNCCAETRMRTVLVMAKAIDLHMAVQKEQEDEQEENNMQQDTGNESVAGAVSPPTPTPLWSEYAAGVVLFSVMHDPSAKVRRATMKLLPSMTASHVGVIGSSNTLIVRVTEVLLAKMRDKDSVVRDAATCQLLSLLPCVITSTPSAMTAAQPSLGFVELTTLLSTVLEYVSRHQDNTKICASMKALLVCLAESKHYRCMLQQALVAVAVSQPTNPGASSSTTCSILSILSKMLETLPQPAVEAAG